MAPHFPTELVEFFLDHLVDCGAHRALARCALVCKAWHYPSTSRRFGAVLLDNDDIDALFELATTSLVPLPDFIRRLRFYEDEAHPLPPAQIMAVRERMPRVEELCLTLSDASLSRYRSVLSAAFPALRTLQFYFRYNTSMDPVLPLIASFPTLQKLDILHARRNFFGGYDFPREYRFPLGLTTVTISSAEMEGFFQQVLRLSAVPLFSSIVWLGFIGWPAEDSAVAHYLRHAGAALHQLHIVPGRSIHFQSVHSAALLGHSTGLRNLQIGSVSGRALLPAAYAPRDILLGVLPHLHAPQLAAITLEVVVPEADAFVYTPATLTGAHVVDLAGDANDATWTALDNALAEDKFAKLERVALSGATKSAVGPRIKENMPFCRARGILAL
ncbi:hypothetical protein C8R46DRAFT_1216021 [Mycena filopes]|nr:hypothetical protein C8R46DRAFT_1216021 [Mycena filopes]